ncbi:MAG TPA: glycosyltransferase [Candidatus Saccharimonadales bacterium]|jgi:glycosyltransferase involved in cell wall biosynthesis|nr:glycosyltransferase [Candidatus Saccharimonadales bacterium]
MKTIKVALVHDYIKEFGGAERVLLTLSEMFPDAPIYTAFRVKNSTADKEFKGKKIIESKFAPVLKIGNLYSPLRFLIPAIWGSFDLSAYDLVITSSSWYITRGFKVGPKTRVIDYCHTPPRWLYGYETSVGFTKYWPVKIYSTVVGHFMRMFDFRTAQQIDYFIANSKNVQARIEKFYRRDSTVIYPPVDVAGIEKATKNLVKENYFLIVSRLVGAKGIEETAKLAKKLDFRLKIVGESHGFSEVERRLKKLSGGNIELLGRVKDSGLFQILGKAKGLIALARDEDFGMTVVESQAAGTPVIAFNGGGFKESVIDGETGELVNEISEKTLGDAIKKVEKTKWSKERLVKNAERFSKERFEKEMLQFVSTYAQKEV